MAWKDFNRKGVGKIVNAGSGTTSSMAQSQFEMQLKDFTDVLLPEYQTVFVKKVSGKLLEEIINKSPVDTGRFRGAWVVNNNTADRSEPNTPDKSEGQANISYTRARVLIESLKQGDVVYISNNLDYALMLEYGWSEKAPEGVVAVSLNEIDAWLQGVKKTAIDSL